jgi:hypothetical protein
MSDGDGDGDGRGDGDDSDVSNLFLIDRPSLFYYPICTLDISIFSVIVSDEVSGEANMDFVGDLWWKSGGTF